jgi:MerR family transcriptional regulator, copper efflux regulator
MKPLTIGEVARQAGVGVETVRFYERQGLLEEPERRASGYRQYDQEAVAVLRFIRRAKELGFTLKEIKGLLGLRLDAEATRAEVRAQAKAKVGDIEAKIADLQRMRDVLQSLIRKCHGDGTTTGCPILGAMEGKEDG